MDRIKLLLLGPCPSVHRIVSEASGDRKFISSLQMRLLSRILLPPFSPFSHTQRPIAWNWMKAWGLLNHSRNTGDLRPLHKSLRTRDHGTSNPLIGEKAEPAQARFTLRLRDQQSECKMDVKSTWHQINHVSWSLGLFLKLTSWGRPNTKPGDHGTLKSHNHSFIIFYHVWGPCMNRIHWNSIWLRAWSHMTSYYTWGSMT